jgi:hypothetical protein
MLAEFSLEPGQVAVTYIGASQVPIAAFDLQLPQSTVFTSLS